MNGGRKLSAFPESGEELKKDAREENISILLVFIVVCP